MRLCGFGISAHALDLARVGDVHEMRMLLRVHAKRILAQEG